MIARFLAVATILCLLPLSLTAQSVNATINGTILDPSGAGVPGAEITLTDVAQGAKRTTTTNESGFYSLPNLRPGEYEVNVAKAGFKASKRAGIRVLLNQIVTADVTLEVGATTETVNVNELVSQVNFTDAVRQEGVSGKELNELPLVVSGGPRSAANFTVLLPGVTTGGTNNAFDARINGGLQTGQEAIMDGVSMQQGTMSQSGMISFFDFRMTPDMVSEFKVLTSNYEPQYGASTSAQMIVETKSGSDQFHGGFFEYLRNEKLNARQFGAESRPLDKEHNFGGFIGGPVKFLPLPGIWKGKSRTYFYTDIEQFKATGGNNRPTITLPTPLMKQGNFSEWRDAAGATIPVLDPATTRANPGFNPALAESATNLRYFRDQFPNNTIPSARIANSLAQAWLKLSPDPNRPGTVNNYQVPTPIPDGILANTEYYMARVDNYFGEKDHFYGTIWRQIAPAKFNSLLPPQLATESFSNPQDSWVNRVNWTHNFTPNLLNHWNIGYLNRNEGYGAISYQYLDQFPKIKGVANANTPPALSFSDGYQSFGGNAGPNLGNLTTRPTWVTTDLVTYVKGNHTWKFGGEWRYLGQDFNTNTNEAGSLGFANLNTGLVGLPRSGHPIASFLLEQVNNANFDLRTVRSWGVRSHGIVFHGGDTWKIKRNLSLNYGLRWDVFTPAFEKNDQFSFFDPDGVNPAAGNLKGRLAFADKAAGAAYYGARYPEKTWYGGFAPRIGLAYSMDSKTVVRAGYGLFFTQNYYPGWGGGANLDGYNSNVSFSSTLGGIGPAFLMADGFPQNFAKPPFLDAGFRNGRGTLYRPVDANRRPYAGQWNLTIEREVASNLLAQVAYVANKGTRLPSALVPVNALNPTELSRGAALNTVFSPGQQLAEGVRAPYTNWAAQLTDAGCKPTVAQALLPFPQFCDGLTGLNENAGNSTYHSLQAKVEKRFSQSIYVLASYTWSKLLTDVQSTNPTANTWGGAVGVISPFERSRNKGLAQDDVRHVFSGSFIYELPFGNGKKFFSGNPAANAVLGGWSVNLITKLSGGTPLFFRGGDLCSGIPEQFRLGCIPGVISGKSALLQDMSNVDVNRPVFDRSAFETVGSVGNRLYYGSGSRITTLRSPKFTNTDFSVVKNVKLFAVKDHPLNLQIRGEFFNVFNEHHFTTSASQGDGGAFVRDLSSPNFGMWNGAVTTPRNIQLAARITF